MTTRQTESQRFVAKFCSYIDELIEAWNTAGDVNYRIQPKEPGAKANYCAVKLGLMTLDGKLPYDSEEWWFNSTAKGAKEKWPERLQELQDWKKRAKALEPDSTLCTLSLEVHVTMEKVEKFIRVADDAVDIQRHSGNPFGVGENPELCVKGQVVNELALELGLIDADWYLANTLGLIQSRALMSSPQKNREINLKLYEELGIDPKCGKQPFAFTDLFHLNGYIEEDELQLLVARAKALPEFKTATTPSEHRKMTLDDLENPIKCTVVAGIVREKSHNVAAKLKRHDYPVVTSARKNYCEVKHAGILWPHKREAFNRYLQNEKK